MKLLKQDPKQFMCLMRHDPELEKDIEPEEGEDQKKFKCIHCDMVYTGASGLWYHNKNFHGLPTKKRPRKRNNKSDAEKKTNKKRKIILKKRKKK